MPKLFLNNSFLILLSLVVGLSAGTVLSISSPDWATLLSAWIAPLGELWVNAIRMTVVPLLMSLLLTAIAGPNGSQSAALGLRTMALFVLFIVASSVFVFVTAPGLVGLISIEPNAAQALLDNAGIDAVRSDTLPPFSEWLTNLIPSNPVAAAAQGAILPLLIFTALFASALTRIDEAPRMAVFSFFSGLRDAMLVLINWVMLLAPVGIFGLVFPLAATLGVEAITALFTFILIACALIMVLTSGLYLAVALLTDIKLVDFARTAFPVQIIGFSTRSSLAALPATFAASKSLGVQESVSGVVLPAAVTLLKFASPVARTSGTYFIAVLYGIDLSVGELFVIAAAIGLFSFYSPGIPSGGLLIMTPVYLSLALPVEGIGILIAIDLIVDMFLTASNVTANISATLLLDKSKRV